MIFGGEKFTKRNKEELRHNSFRVMIFSGVILVLLNGCASSPTAVSSGESIFENRKNLEKISMGMSKKDVQTIMGSKIVIKGVHNVERVIDNPYKSEKILYGKINNKDKYWEVWYYADFLLHRYGGHIDYSFEPLIFEDDKIVGKGYNFFKEEQYEKMQEK